MAVLMRLQQRHQIEPTPLSISHSVLLPRSLCACSCLATEVVSNIFIVTTDHAGVLCIVSCTRLMASEVPLMCDVFHVQCRTQECTCSHLSCFGARLLWDLGISK